MKLSQNGINLIKNLEGYREKSYKCSAGKLTIGYGHTDGVYEDQKITKEQAENFLKKDVEEFEKNVNYINKKKKYNLNQNQFDSLVSFTFNLGPGKLNTLTQNRTKSQLPDGMKFIIKQIKKLSQDWLIEDKRKSICLINQWVILLIIIMLIMLILIIIIPILTIIHLKEGPIVIQVT